jgi:ankyrin repeat protein
MIAAERGRLDLVSLLLAKGASVALNDALGSTALHAAARSREGTQCARALLEAGASVNAHDAHGATPLTYANELGNAETVALLTSKGGDPKRFDDRGVRKSFIDAAQKGDLPTLRRLLAEGMNPNIGSSDRPGSGGSALVTAATFGQLEVVKFLVEHGAVLYWDEAARASARNGVGVTRFLAKREATLPPGVAWQHPWRELWPEILEELCDLPLAAPWERQARADLVRFLLEKGVRPDATLSVHRGKGLAWAVQGRQWDLAGAFLKAGADPSPALLRLAGTREAKPEGVRFLLEKGARLSARDSDGRTPLLLAAFAGNLEAVHCLFDLGADPRPKDRNGRTPLHLAHGDGRLIRLLVERGYGPNEPDWWSGMTPLMLASKWDFPVAVNEVGTLPALLTAGADPRATDLEGDTALHCAARAGNAWAIRLLLKAGADPGARNKSGKRPLDVVPPEDREKVEAALRGGGTAPTASFDAAAIFRIFREQDAAEPMGKQVRLVPNTLDDGEVHGFKVFAVRPGTALARLGLLNGDVVLAVDDTSLDSRDSGSVQVMEVLQKILEGSAAHLKILRKDTKLVLPMDRRSPDE